MMDRWIGGSVGMVRCWSPAFGPKVDWDVWIDEIVDCLGFGGPDALVRDMEVKEYLGLDRPDAPTAETRIYYRGIKSMRIWVLGLGAVYHFWLMLDPDLAIWAYLFMALFATVIAGILLYLKLNRQAHRQAQIFLLVSCPMGSIAFHKAFDISQTSLATGLFFPVWLVLAVVLLVRLPVFRRRFDESKKLPSNWIPLQGDQ
ncbi:MAG: hypothetical protein JJU20_12910 [Opitutales bacterium]|nr:hypothetical protein [Opitutales bacterium]